MKRFIHITKFALPAMLILSTALFGGDSKNIALVKKFDAAWNARDLDAAMAFYAEDATVITPDGRTLKGKAEIAAWVKTLLPGFRVESANFREEGNLVRWDFTVYSDVFAGMGVNPVRGTGTVEIVNGKVKSFQPVFDQETNCKLVVNRFFQMYDGGADLNEMGEVLFAPGFMAYYPGQPAMNTEGYKQLGAMFRTGFAGIKHAIESQIAEGEWVATRGTITATHSGEFQGVPASGKPVKVTFSVFDKVSNGKLAERYVDFDLLGMMQQIGAIPMPQQAQR
jgi:predicted ester cyclase/limonene-1,2-epoxide hydrolase